MKKVLTGLQVLVSDKELQNNYKGNVALLCHNASVDASCTPAVVRFKEMFGDKFIKLFGPQHGFSTDAQDNMIETNHFVHPFFNMPVYSLYSETRVPTDEMLEGINHLFVDLQDVGCRMYTYIYTLTLLLEKCAEKEIQVIVLDRPNPINGETLEGNILDMKYSSFIGLFSIPVRHGLTIGEVGLMHQKYWAQKKANYQVIEMKNWKRNMYFSDTGLPWLLPSPNLARPESALTFPGMVLFEGTELSEGRGTTQSLEIVGHPKLEPFEFFENHFKQVLREEKLAGITFRPITFLPTFQKQMDKICGGVQMHITDRNICRPWRAGQLLMRELYHYLGSDFKWKNPPYEYDYINMPIDIINGTNELRKWVEQRGNLKDLDKFESFNSYQIKKAEIEIY